ncbi:MAG TPA: sigma-70 family RNA polymerase sigma factor [Ktedonobacteraceae bacterium]|nr:sigma-70 family RNA polymerase sigma factor [Ktedonobacteraceae bacterium]
MVLVEGFSFQQYRADISSVPRITDEELHTLAHRITNARPHLATLATHRLTEGYLWLVFKQVNHSSIHTQVLSKLDLVQEGTIGLMRAVERYDFATLSGDFTAYAATSIHYAMLDALPMEDSIQVGHHTFWRERAAGHIEAMIAMQPISLDACYSSKDKDGHALSEIAIVPPASTASSRDQSRTQALVEALLARLTPREQQVIRMRYGLDEQDGREQTPTVISQQLGLDCSTVCNIIRRALQKMRAEETPHKTCQRAQGHTPHKQDNQRQQQYARLVAASAHLEAQGQSVTVHALARLAHVDKAVIQEFLRAQRAHQGSEQERLVAARSQLEAQGQAVTCARLCAGAHVSFKVAATFLRAHPCSPKPKRPVVSASRATSQARLSRAYAELEAQGQPITKTRLRQLAGVGTDIAGAFLREKRANEARQKVLA